jgi:hypothetical protein
VASEDEARARLEAQAAEILGRARAQAASIVLEAQAARDQARREVVMAQEQALSIRSEAQHTADGIIERATLRARTESDELLREARRQLAHAVDEAREAEARADAARHAEAEALERLAAAPPMPSPVPAPVVPTVTTVATRPTPVIAEPWFIDLSEDPMGDLVAGAVHAAVRKAIHPVVIRAGRYTVVRVPS